MTEIKNLKASQLYYIQAAVLEQLEKIEGVSFETQYPTQLTQDKDNTWCMVFCKKNITLAEMNTIVSNLGKNFDMEIVAKDKPNRLQIVLKAPSKEFVKLLPSGTLQEEVEEPLEPEMPVILNENE